MTHQPEPLKDYIDRVHGGAVYQAAAALGVTPPTVYKWMRAGALVIDGKLYTPSGSVRRVEG